MLKVSPNGACDLVCTMLPTQHKANQPYPCVLVFKELVSGEYNAPAVNTAIASHDTTHTYHYESASDPNMKGFRDTAFILLTHLVSELSEDAPFIDLSPHPLLQELEAHFLVCFEMYYFIK